MLREEIDADFGYDQNLRTPGIQACDIRFLIPLRQHANQLTRSIYRATSHSDRNNAMAFQGPSTTAAVGRMKTV